MTNESMIIVLLFVLAIALAVLYGIEKYKNRDLLWKGEQYKEIADRNKALILEIEELRERTFDAMMSDWKRTCHGEHEFYETDDSIVVVSRNKVTGCYTHRRYIK